MAKDDETGVDPKAKDGQPNSPEAELELERRRALKAERERQEEASTGMSDHGKRGRAIDGQPDEDAPTEAELFPEGSVQGDHAVTMKNIVPAGKGRKTEAKMGATAIPLRDGLVRYGRLLEVLVTVEAGKIAEVPDLEEQDSGGERKLLGVKDVQHFRPVHVTSAEGMLTVGQVVDILEREFAIPRSSDKVAKVFGPQTPEQRQAAAAG